MLDAFWTFFENPANRDAVGRIGGIVVVASGLGPIIKFLSKKDMDRVRLTKIDT